MKKVGVVVLNYKNYEETIKCVLSILKQNKILLKIVIVDNGSNNESVGKLTDAFENNNTINVWL